MTDDEMNRIMMENYIIQAEAERRRACGEFTEQEKKLRVPLTREEIIKRLSEMPQAHAEPVIAHTVKSLERYPETHESHILLSAVEILAGALGEMRKHATREAAVRPMAPFKVKIADGADPDDFARRMAHELEQFGTGERVPFSEAAREKWSIPPRVVVSGKIVPE